MKMEKNNKPLCRSLKNDTRGLSSVEYLILLVVIAVASIAVWNQIGEKVKGHADASNKALGEIKAPAATPGTSD